MTIETSGPNQNSYVTLSEANALLLTMRASFMDADEQLDDDDAALLIEAANDLETLWRWTGMVADNAQPMSWPRKYVRRPNTGIGGELGWSIPCDDDAEYARHWINFIRTGTDPAGYLPSDTVPRAIKEAQVLIAVLRKKEGNLIGDNRGDDHGLQLGPLKVGYVNAVRESADIHKRTAQLGNFIGDGLLRVPNEQ